MKEILPNITWGIHETTRGYCVTKWTEMGDGLPIDLIAADSMKYIQRVLGQYQEVAEWTEAMIVEYYTHWDSGSRTTPTWLKSLRCTPSTRKTLENFEYRSQEVDRKLRVLQETEERLYQIHRDTDIERWKLEGELLWKKRLRST